MRLEFSAYVEEDFEEVAADLTEYGSVSADRILHQLRTALIRVARTPLHFPRRPEIHGTARASVVGKYIILFTLSGQRVCIERIVHGSRYLPTLFHDALENG